MSLYQDAAKFVPANGFPMSISEIAAELNITEDEVQTALKEGIRKLKKFFRTNRAWSKTMREYLHGRPVFTEGYHVQKMNRRMAPAE